MILLPYDLTLKEPLLFQRAGQNFKMSSKKGFILKIEKDDFTSYADLSPLEHWSKESYVDAHKACQKIKINEIFRAIDLHLEDENAKEVFIKEKFLDFDFSNYTHLASLKHALSCLFSDFYRQKLKISIPGKTLFHGLVLRNKAISDEASIQKAMDLERTGFKKIKVKIGQSDSKDENLFLNNLLKKTKHVQLRLDANRNFNLDDYALILKNLDLRRIDYIEEPVSKTIELLSFASTAKISIALDENIRLIKDVRIDGVKSVIIKPTLIGDYHTIKKIVTRSRSRGISPVIGSSFESQIGIYQLAQLANALNPDELHGLDTFECFLENLMDLDIQNNAICLKENVELKGPLYV
jgi:o-succinylbenzoate synthase